MVAAVMTSPVANLTVYLAGLRQALSVEYESQVEAVPDEPRACLYCRPGKVLGPCSCGELCEYEGCPACEWAPAAVPRFAA